MKSSRSELNLLSQTQFKSVPIDIKTPRTNIYTRTNSYEELTKNGRLIFVAEK